MQHHLPQKEQQWLAAMSLLSQVYPVAYPENKSSPADKNTATNASQCLAPENFSAKILSESDLEQLFSLYGMNIEDVAELNAGQKWMFEKATVVKSAFFLQFLLRVKLPLKPSTFREKVDRVAQNRDNYRSAYASTGLSQPYRVVLKNRRAEIVFSDLSATREKSIDEKLRRIMAADRRRGIDLERDPLLRIHVLKLPGEDMHAFIISQPHINSDGVSIGMLIKDILIDYAMKLDGLEEKLSAYSLKNYAEFLDTVDKQGDLDYWKSVLKDLPPLTKIPGVTKSEQESDIATYVRLFKPATVALLKKSQGRYKSTLNCIMQGAWGIMLQKLYGTDDVTFGSITSGRDAEMSSSSKISGGFVNAFPVRSRALAENTLGQYFQSFTAEYMTSISKAHVSPTEIQQALGRKEPVFDHLLNSHNFSSFGGSMASGFKIPGIEFLGGELFDNLSTDLCVYFVSPNGEYGCNYTYNRNAVPDENIRILADCYERVIEQIARADAGTPVREIRCVDISVFEKADILRFANHMVIAGKLRKISVFDSLPELDLLSLAETCIMRSYVADDVILKARSLPETADFVTKGFVELSRTGLDGWEHSLKSVKAGNLLSLSGVLDDSPSYVTATAISNDVEILSIPRTVMTELMEKFPSVSLKLLKDAETDARNYSYLWITAD